MRLANDIFGWKIDFALEIQPGDSSTSCTSRNIAMANSSEMERFLAAGFVNEGVVHRAVYFESADGVIRGYFGPEGRSMRRQFLRAPLDFTRISSNFDPRRAIRFSTRFARTKAWTMQRQQERSSRPQAMGALVSPAHKGGYGRVVILEHGGGISTLYGHMSRFAKGIAQWPAGRTRRDDRICWQLRGGHRPSFALRISSKRRAQESTHRAIAGRSAHSHLLYARVPSARRRAARATRSREGAVGRQPQLE